MRQRKKRQKNSETDTSHERNVTERSGAEWFSPFLSFPLSDRLSFSWYQSVNLSLSPQIISRQLSSGFSCHDRRPTTRRPTAKGEHTTFRRLLLLKPGADCGPTTLARARPEEKKLPGPNHASAAIFYLRRESGV